MELVVEPAYQPCMTDADPITSDPLQLLTAREKDALRLLAKGYDAKSIARELGLSVHTINERLRDVRQKLRVSSSREAARRFADSQAAPQSLVDDRLRMEGTIDRMMHPGRRVQDHRLAWFGGGMLVMSLMIAALVFSFVSRDEQTSNSGTVPSAAAAPVEASLAASSAARAWVALLDQARWRDSWQAAARLFTSQLSAEQWATMARATRGPLGRISNRTLVHATRTNSLPNVPPGDYQIVQFATTFAARKATETVILAREGATWKVAGYFVIVK